MTKILLALGAAALLLTTAAFAQEAHTATHEVHWNYDDHGPATWCDFSALCKEGKLQSPIDIVTKDAVAISAVNVIKMNESTEAKSQIIDNGHAIQVNIENGGIITVDGVDYKLVQFHFHGKSEEKINGKQSDLVAHMVHKSAFGNLLVIGVLFNEGKTANAMLDTVIKGVGTSGTMNPAALLPKDTEHYFHFMGSLTTPPCSENVKWYVMKEAQSATKEQITAMRKYYDHNYRPTQELNGRKVESK
ncbi:MAG: carbonic anhydrase family protein [Sulfuricurvum sp.]|nr:carbonic anhydrase family protein [Sulfuricurvum sp.]